LVAQRTPVTNVCSTFELNPNSVPPRLSVTFTDEAGRVAFARTYEY
jgi:hypothetical protein